jgi:predicted dehydrogenase
MNYNRRNFLKLAGVTGAGMFGSCNLKGTESSNKNSNSKLEHIRKESTKSYSQIFNMSGYAAPKLNKVRIGFIGLGGRGSAAVTRLSYIEGVEIKGLCDLLPERAEEATERIKTPGHSPDIYSGKEEVWMEMCNRDDLDLIYIATPWHLHATMGIFAMEHGKHVATEIPAATTVEDSWKLVQTSEKTKKHCVMLENCCYDYFELLTLNLARNGFFGDIVHCEGAYIHEIGESLFHRGNPDERWRLKQNIARNGNLYPTHGLGPVAHHEY